MIKRIFILAFLIFAFNAKYNAQSVGVVLSGGGASGVAHIGVLKALEENNIPIDYICGTSIGALVGGMYAAGYSPDEIEKIITSDYFKNLAYGNIESKYIYYFKQKDDDASWFTFKLDTTFESSLPTNLINPIPIDFELMKMFGVASKKANYNFDSLFVPFRCVAADIEDKKYINMKSGDLGQSIRASMSYPFYLKPIKINGRLLFDGGIYNNFPSDVMYDDFYPDIIIGSNVTGNVPSPDEDNLFSQMKVMLMTKTSYDAICENGLIIEPGTKDVAAFSFDNMKTLVDSGYSATNRNIEKIKSLIEKRQDKSELDAKRKNFKNGSSRFVFGKINVENLKPGQTKYVNKLLKLREDTVNIDKLKKQYYRLASDDKVKNIYPLSKWNEKSNSYDLNLKIKKEKNIIAEIGGNISNRPINTGYIGFQYNILSRVSASLNANAYFGKLYTAIQFKPRFDFPSRVPFYLEPNFTFHRWDYFKSSSDFFEDVKPAFLVHREEYATTAFGMAVGNKGKMVLDAGVAQIRDQYYQTNSFSVNDTADRTDFNLATAQISIEMNSLNRKQYASSGALLSFKTRYVLGEEISTPGSTGIDSLKSNKTHEWVQFKVVIDKYLVNRGIIRPGVYFEGVYSTQTLFRNYTSSILTSPSFQPLPEMKTLFLEKYRTHKYFAFGLKNIISFNKNLEFRLEGYAYQPFQMILKQTDFKAGYSAEFSKRFFIATGAIVYHTPVGPVCMSVNYYDQEKQPFTFLFHFGYIIFNKKVLD